MMLDRSGFKESIENILIAVPDSAARPRNSSGDMHSALVAAELPEILTQLCRRNSTQKQIDPAVLTKRLLGSMLSRMGEQRIRFGWILAPCFIGDTFTRREREIYTLHSCRKKSKGAPPADEPCAEHLTGLSFMRERSAPGSKKRLSSVVFLPSLLVGIIYPSDTAP